MTSHSEKNASLHLNLLNLEHNHAVLGVPEWFSELRIARCGSLERYAGQFPGGPIEYAGAWYVHAEQETQPGSG